MVICVDLDGTLIKTDSLHESILLFIKKNPLNLLLCLCWLLKGKAHLKQQIANHVELHVDTLPYNKCFIEWLKNKKAKGNKLVLVTAANQAVAQDIAQYLEMFDEVFGSNEKTNLKGKTKKKLLDEQYGQGNYTYVGNSTADLPIWETAQGRVVINAPKTLLKQVEKMGKVEFYIPKEKQSFKKTVKALRIHQYVKNLLLFLPWVLGFSFSNPSELLSLFIGFISFSLLASSVYILNDLLDLEADRAHHSKCNRAFAAGDISIPLGVLMGLCCFIPACLLAYYLPFGFKLILIGYYVLTCFYSFKLKKLVLLDVYTLALLYTSRILAGMAIISAGFSSWLILFSFFFFTSLAFIKRYTELFFASQKEKSIVQGRGYTTENLLLVKIFGISSGFISVLIFGLYLNSERANLIYAHPQVLSAVCPIILYWISRIWLKASNGLVHDDPIIFAIRDKVTYLTITLIGIVMLFSIY